MLKIRLQRTGKTNNPYFRVIVAPHTYKPRTGKPTEILGNLNIQKGEAKLEGERIKYWISKGAQVSPTVYNLLIDEKIVAGPKRETLARKKKKTDDK